MQNLTVRQWLMSVLVGDDVEVNASCFDSRMFGASPRAGGSRLMYLL